MPNLIDIRRRIKSVKSTKQITRAMKFVATAKLKKAQARVFAARPYAKRMLMLINGLAERAPDRSNPLLQDRGDARVLLVVITGDKGLCGAFNSNILKSAYHFMYERKDKFIELDLIGKRGCDHFSKRSFAVMAQWVDALGKVDVQTARRVAEPVVEAFTQGRFDRVYVVYNQFKSVVQQEIAVEQVLPITGLETSVGDEKGFGGVDYIYDQPRGLILGDLFSRHTVVQLYHAMLESVASEQGARMSAMELATKNADEMIQKLTLFRNRVRQAAITNEIIEIVSGANAQ